MPIQGCILVDMMSGGEPTAVSRLNKVYYHIKDPKSPWIKAFVNNQEGYIMEDIYDEDAYIEAYSDISDQCDVVFI